MFELYLTLCLAATPDICAERMVPSPVALSEQVCVETALGRAENWVQVYDNLTLMDTRCGDVADAPKIDIVEVADGVWVHKGRSENVSPENLGDIANLSFVVGDDSIAVIDTGGSRPVAEGFYAAIRSVSDLPISHLVVTHMHPDHSLGAKVFREAGAEVIGNAHLQDALQRRAETYEQNFQRLVGAQGNIGFKIILPDRGITEQDELDLGGRRILVQAHPTAHTNNDLTAIDSKTKTLFSGDLVFLELTPVIDGRLLGWIDVLDDLRAMDVELLIPGHGEVPQAWPGGLDDVTNYLNALRDQTRIAVAHGDSMSDAIETVAQDQRGDWHEFDLNHPRNATVAYTELEWE